MTIPVEFILRLRNMIAEPTSETYTDELLEQYIEQNALLDEDGNRPTLLDWTKNPPEPMLNALWIPTYDLNAVAAQIWTEKAGKFAGKFDFSADGGNYHRSQIYKQMMDNARTYRSMRAGRTIRAHYSPKRVDNV